MKILCIIDSLGSGGAQRQLVELAKGFKQRGHEVGFITYHEINFFKPVLEKNNIWVKTIVEPNYFKRLLKIRRFIRNQQPNAILSFLEAANFISTIAGFPLRKWKLVVGERSANPNILKSKKLKFYRYFHFFADYIVANSFENLKLVEKVNPLINSKKKKVIYNIVNTPVFEEKVNINSKTSIIIAASYRPVKNFDGLIEAVNLLPNEYKEKLKIEWYGNIEDDEYYTDNIIKINKYDISGIFHLNPPTTDIYSKYIDADFIGLFSHYEGFPNTICEGMSIGKPVLVSKISDIPLFINEGENGFLCNSTDIESIKNILIKAIDTNQNLKENMKINNLKLAKKKFDKEFIIEEYLKLLVNESK